MCLLRCSASRFVGIAAAVFGLGLLAVAIPASCSDSEDMKQAPVVHINVRRAELGAAINLLMAQTGAEITLREFVKPYGLITLSLDNKPLDTVLKMMCYSAGASLRQENGVYIIGPMEDAKDTQVAAVRNASEALPASVVPPARIKQEKIHLRMSRPSAIMKLLGRDPGGVNRLEQEVEDQLSLTRDKPFREFNQRQSAQQLAAMGAITPGAAERQINAQRAAPYVPTGENAIIPRVGDGTNGNEEGQYGGGTSGGMRNQGLGGGLGGSTGLGGARGGTGSAGNASSSLQILAFDADNSIIVRGNEDEVDDLKELIRMLDVQVRQLMIKAEFVTATEWEINSFGINWTLARGGLTVNAQNQATVGAVNINYATGNVVANLLTTLTRDKNHVIEAPMVTTMNNVGVSIAVGQQIPVITTSTNTGNTGNVISTGSNANYIFVGSGVSVLPRINSDDTITMNVTPSIQILSGYNTDANGNKFPVVDYQSITVNRRVKNGEMIVIGGLQDKNTLNSNNMIPILGDLPLIGTLFRSRSSQVTAKDLLVFVTASIIPDPVTGETTGGSVGAITPR